MDDAWELANGLDPTNPDDRNLRVESGYTVLEVYLNSLVGEEIPLLITSINNPKVVNDITFGVNDNKLTVSCAHTPVIHLKVYNTMGQSLIEISEKGVTSVNISALPVGIYFAEAITTDKFRKVFKFKK